MGSAIELESEDHAISGKVACNPSIARQLHASNATGRHRHSVRGTGRSPARQKRATRQNCESIAKNHDRLRDPPSYHARFIEPFPLPRGYRGKTGKMKTRNQGTGDVFASAHPDDLPHTRVSKRFRSGMNLPDRGGIVLNSFDAASGFPQQLHGLEHVRLHSFLHTFQRHSIAVLSSLFSKFFHKKNRKFDLNYGRCTTKLCNVPPRAKEAAVNTLLMSCQWC